MSKIFKKLTVCAAIFLIAACSAQFRNHGYMPLNEDVNQLIIGVDTRDSATEALGTPTTGGVLEDGNLYYIRSKVKHNGLFEPKEIDRQILRLSFNSKGLLKNIERFGLEDGKVVVLDYRVTPSGMKDMSFLLRLFQSVGGPSASTFLQ